MQIEDELDLATASFLENPEGVAVDAEGETVVLSKLFQWYRADFGESTNAMVKWVKKRVKDEVRKLEQEYKLCSRIRTAITDYCSDNTTATV